MNRDAASEHRDLEEVDELWPGTEPIERDSRKYPGGIGAQWSPTVVNQWLGQEPDRLVVDAEVEVDRSEVRLGAPHEDPEREDPEPDRDCEDDGCGMYGGDT